MGPWIPKWSSYRIQAATLLSLVLSLCYPKSAVASLSQSLRLEILENTSELLDEIFSMNTYGSMAIANLMEKSFLGDDFSKDNFDRIRDASWAVFKALPVVTSLGVTAVNGLTAVYNRGFKDEIEGFKGNFCLYANDTSDAPVYYKEYVSEATGKPLGPPLVLKFPNTLQDTPWFQKAMSYPINNLTWTIGRSLTSGQAFVQCGISKQARATKEVALVHSSLSAIAINSFISSLELKGGSVFIADEHGTLLFSSEPTVCVLSNRSECENTPLDRNSVLNDGKSFLQNRVGLANLVMSETHVSDVILKGKRYSVDSWPYTFKTVKLSVVVMIPRHSFWGPMDYYTRITWISLPLLSIGVVFIGCSLIYLLVEQVQAEEKLRAEILRQSEAKHRAEASRDAKTNFLSSMSHELRTPMACIIGLLDMLLMENLTVEHEGSIRQIHRCATSLVSLLNSALDIAKVESGKLVLEKAEFNLEAELTALIDVFSVQCDNKNLFISLDVADDVPKRVIGDSARVMQVFTNLVGNSLKFTSKGRIMVRVRIANPEADVSGKLHQRSFSPFSLERFNEASNAPDLVVLVFEVDDTGPGIEPALREKIFENFVQGNASTTRTHGGTGLGLGIVRSLVQLMGGSIRIVEKSGPGVVFQFSICFQRATSCDCTPFSLPPPYQGTEIIVGIPDPDCRAVACEWITKLGLSVHQVESWEQILLYMRALNGISSGEGGRTGLFEDFLSNSSADDHQQPTSAPSRPSSWSQRFDFWRSWKDGDERPITGQVRQLMILDTSLLPRDVKAEHLEEYLQESGFLTTSPSRYLDGLGVASTFDINDRHRRELQGDFSVVWVCASNVHEPIKAALRAVRSSFIVKRPLHTARLKEIFYLVSREGDVMPSMEIQRPQELHASSIINYAKQQEWNDPYACDAEVPLAQEPSPRPIPSAVVLGRNVRHRPTATKSAPLEEISYSEMESISSDSFSQDSTPTCKPMKRSVAALAQLNGRKNGNASAPKPLEMLEILVAEDTPLLRKLAVAMLKRLGAVTFEASNGQEVLEAVMARMLNGQAPFQCILMDCQMPVMDGYESCKAVREFEKKYPCRTAIVALTANAMASDERKCLNAGMDAFLTKPIDQEYMVQIILRTVGYSNSAVNSPHANSVSENTYDS
ncbi:histidine kinase 1 isoform X2 [Physcomitrium patens]|uniref:Histidine kinase n=1 Tax=Physcomitrium patens TaxID=3218 RepID=A0A7I4C602_PHYPA|nr:histidine kinase 1-like isoform X2 [Physcomitrium patens]|eukprot:XP_024358846.1 histidine kinase 1-like isoform X2 [Physcomitrella patens]